MPGYNVSDGIEQADVGDRPLFRTVNGALETPLLVTITSTGYGTLLVSKGARTLIWSPAVQAVSVAALE